MTDRDVVTHIIAAVEIGLNVDKMTKKSGNDIDNVKTAAEFVLCHMLNSVGHYPPTNESAQVSAIKSEQDEVYDGESGETSKYVRYFLFDDMFIFSVIDQPDEKGGPACTIITRDVTGKYIWDSKLIYDPLPQPYAQIEPRGKWTGSTSNGLTGHTPEQETNSLVVTFSEPAKLKDRAGVDKLESLIDEEEQLEQGFTQNNKDYMSMDLSILPPKLPPKYDKECKFQMSRLILSHLGFFNHNLQSRFCQLQPNAKLLRSLRLLDAAPERDCHKIGVIYVKEGQDQQQEILCNMGGSDRYEKFLDSLGWRTTLNKHLGFLGGLDATMNSTGSEAPYYADYKLEVMFHVPSMMPTTKKEPQQIHKKRHVGNDHVNIIWTEHTRDYYKNTIVSHFNFVHIVIYPLVNGLFRVDVHVKDENQTPLFGPLCVGSIVLSEHVLAPLVRNTALSGNRLARKHSTGYSKPYVSRKALIAELAQRYKSKLDTSKYYATMFMSKQDSVPILDPTSVSKK
jgi:hypothetical protein